MKIKIPNRMTIQGWTKERQGLNILIICLLGMLSMGISDEAFGQNVRLDLTQVDTGKVIMKTFTSLDTASTDTLIEVPVPASQSMELQMKYDETPHSYVKFDVDAQGEISNVRWKANQQDTANYHVLDTARYELSASKKEIKLKACKVLIDYEELDFGGFKVEYLDVVTGASTFFGDPDGHGTYKLFPGNYRLTSTVSDAAIGFQVLDNCSIDSNVVWKLGLDAGGQWQGLHAEAFRTGGDTLKLLPFELEVNVHLEPGQVAKFESFKAGHEDIAGGGAEVARLSPGRYHIVYHQGQAAEARVGFEILNFSNRLSPQLEWEDLIGNRTGGGLAILDPGIIYLTPNSLSSSGIFPPPWFGGGGVQPYAVLKDKLDAGYYHAVDGELRIRYDERYDNSSDLDLRIWDDQNNEIQLNGPVARHYGTNWITLQLPGTSFQQGAYYVLEVRSGQGDVSMLRFRYD